MKKKTVILLSILGGILILAGLSYAYYTSGIIGSERTSTVTINSGDIEIVVDGGENITARDIVPSNSPFATKTITLTAKNTTALKTPYTIKLVVDNNTFTNGAIKYSLTGEGEAETGELIADTTLEEINVTSYLGNGYFTTGNNLVHTYTLKIYFPDTGENQIEDMGKVFNAHIEVAGKPVNAPDGWYEAGSNTLLAAIKRNSALNTDDSLLTKPGQEIADTDEQLRVAEDDYGTSYYFRGNVQNNYVIFANKCWKIVRVLGNGAIKLFYWGDVTDNKCGEVDNTLKSSYNNKNWNNENTDNTNINVSKRPAGIGFMYGDLMGDTYDKVYENKNDSTVLTFLKSWYNTTFNTNELKSALADVIWCNDKSIDKETGNGNGFQIDVDSHFKTRTRVNNNAIASPSLLCSTSYIENGNKVNIGNLSRFTANDTSVGNGKLSGYKIGLITGDEAAFAGTAFKVNNNNFYLFVNESQWTISPVLYSANAKFATVLGINNNGNLGNNYVNGVLVVHPTVSLIPSVTISSGNGEANSPYVVNGVEE